MDDEQARGGGCLTVGFGGWGVSRKKGRLKRLKRGGRQAGSGSSEVNPGGQDRDNVLQFTH